MRHNIFAALRKKGAAPFFVLLGLRPGSSVAIMPLRSADCIAAPLEDNNTLEKEDIPCCPHRSDR